jgi:hypothetical protein
MTSRGWPLLAAVLLVLLSGCHESDDFVAPGGLTRPGIGLPAVPPPSAMAYSGSDENGAEVVRGWIRVDLPHIMGSATGQPGTVGAGPETVGGAWELAAVGDAKDLGPQIGSGVLTGEYTEGKLVANLNPDLVNDNVILEGTLSIVISPVPRMRYEGTWTWVTIDGPRRSGKFQAQE